MDRTSWQTIKCGIKLTILLSILLWSGILVVGLHRQYQLLAKAKDQVEKDLVGFGFSSSKMAENSPVVRCLQDRQRYYTICRIKGMERIMRQQWQHGNSKKRGKAH